MEHGQTDIGTKQSDTHSKNAHNKEPRKKQNTEEIEQSGRESEEYLCETELPNTRICTTPHKSRLNT